MGGHILQFLGIASAQNDIVGFEGCDQAVHHILHIAPPLFFPVLFQSIPPHVALIGPLLVREMTQFHWLHNAIHNEG
jgi:hypothetical protein